jgi:hypothetical protein
MSRRRPLLLVPALAALLVLMDGARTADAQSLADVARREQERRADVQSGKIYTNADLTPVAASPAREVPSPAALAAARDAGVGAAGESEETLPEESREAEAAEPGGPGTVIEGREKRDEQYWRNRARDIRGRLARAVADAGAARARLDEIEAAPPSPSAAREHEVMAGALQRLQANVGFLRAELEQFEARARIESVPSDWTP